MKKLLLFIPFMLLLAIGVQAQEMSKDTKKEMKLASRALNRFKVDNSDKSHLEEAIKQIDAVMEMSDAQNSAEAWQTKGEIYGEVATQYITIKQLGIGSTEGLPDPNGKAIVAMEAFMKAHELAEKSRDKNSALDGIRTQQNNMSQLGVYQYEAGNYDQAFASFNGVIRAHDVLKENGEESALSKEDDYNQQLYITGLSAMQANKMPSAAVYFEKLYEINFDKPLIYEAMYKIKSAEDPEGAIKYLNKGRELYPDDPGLLFAEINYYLRAGKTDVLVEKLKTAIEKEPGNKSLYFTLGNVYDQFYQSAVTEGDKEKEQEYFNKAMEQYDKALEIDADYVDAVYGKGALYYNKAASISKELQDMPVDVPAEKFKAKQDEQLAQFDKALPYFKRAEQMNPNDINTLIALKEIFARKGDFETSQEFKKRLENAQAGGENESSYFKNN